MHSRNTRLGIVLFAVYLVFYGGFVLLAAFWPDSLAVLPLAGVSLAIWYGFALIFVALVLALIYGWACRIEQQPPHVKRVASRGHDDEPGGRR